MFDVPVALFAYNRPELTRRVLSAIRIAAPRQLFVVLDGPRVAADVAPCAAVRGLLSTVDWPCTVEVLSTEQNLGCARRVSSGLRWVFAQVDRAVILEDDTVPDPSFFSYCRTLLERYADDERVMQIGGCNVAGVIDFPFAYGFSRFTLPPWGWATWARAWRHYEFDLSFWDDETSHMQARLGDTFPMWDAIIRAFRMNPVSWDVQWNVALWRHNGWSLQSAKNMVSNIGWGPQATLTTNGTSVFSAMSTAANPLGRGRHPRDPGDSFDAQLEPVLLRLFADVSELPDLAGSPTTTES